MKEFFAALCAFIILSGALRCLVDERRFSRCYGVISGIILLMIILSGVRSFTLPEFTPTQGSAVQGEGGYEMLVLERAQSRLSSAASELVYEQTRVSCTVRVTLSYAEEQVRIASIDVDGIRRDSAVAAVLSDYFSVEEGDIHFHG